MIDTPPRGPSHPGWIQRGISQEKYEAELAAGNKWCYRCAKFLPPDKFGAHHACRECRAIAQHLFALKKYGVSGEWYIEKMAEQGNVCGICGKPPASEARRFSTDHSHVTGKVRGVLCGRCNTAIERIETIPNWEMLAVAYLQRYSKEHAEQEKKGG